MQVTYRIAPTLTDAGEPMWTLFRDWAGHLGAGTILLARNADRAVLERAIEHLKLS